MTYQPDAESHSIFPSSFGIWGNTVDSLSNYSHDIHGIIIDLLSSQPWEVYSYQ
jgi:hypothetical protein